MHTHGPRQTSWGRVFVVNHILTFQGRCKSHEVPVSDVGLFLKTDREKKKRKKQRACDNCLRKSVHRNRIHLCGCTSHLLISYRVLWPSCDESFCCSKACWDRMVKHSRSGVQIPQWFHPHPSGSLEGRLSSVFGPFFSFLSWIHERVQAGLQKDCLVAENRYSSVMNSWHTITPTMTEETWGDLQSKTVQSHQKLSEAQNVYLII